MASSAWGQYIGYVYPAGGQQGTTFHIELPAGAPLESGKADPGPDR